MSGHTKDVEMTTAMLAERLGCSHRTAIREMRRVEQEHPGIVKRVGNRKRQDMVAMASELAPFIRGLRGETALEREVRLLRERLKDVEGRLDAHVERELAFRAMAHRWFQMVGKPMRSI